MVDLANIDGNPAEVAQVATTQLANDAATLIRKVYETEKFVRNAAMSELMEIDEDATPEELIDSWNSSTEKRLLDELKMVVSTRANRLDQIVRQYEGYDEEHDARIADALTPNEALARTAGQPPPTHE